MQLVILQSRRLSPPLPPERLHHFGRLKRLRMSHAACKGDFLADSIMAMESMRLSTSQLRSPSRLIFFVIGVILGLLAAFFLSRRRVARGVPPRDAWSMHAAKCTVTHEAKGSVGNMTADVRDQNDTKMQKKGSGKQNEVFLFSECIAVEGIIYVQTAVENCIKPLRTRTGCDQDARFFVFILGYLPPPFKTDRVRPDKPKCGVNARACGQLGVAPFKAVLVGGRPLYFH